MTRLVNGFVRYLSGAWCYTQAAPLAEPALERLDGFIFDKLSSCSYYSVKRETVPANNDYLKVF